MATTLELTDEILALKENDKKYHQKRMKLMVQYLTRYMETYDQQSGYENYSDETFINDVLYGLGVALNPEQHQFADGFQHWKEKLLQHLQQS